MAYIIQKYKTASYLEKRIFFPFLDILIFCICLNWGSKSISIVRCFGHICHLTLIFFSFFICVCVERGILIVLSLLCCLIKILLTTLLYCHFLHESFLDSQNFCVVLLFILQISIIGCVTLFCISCSFIPSTVTSSGLWVPERALSWVYLQS